MNSRPGLRAGAALSSTAAGEVAQIRRGAAPHHPSAGNAHRLAGPRIPGHTCLAEGGVEHPKPPEHHTVAAHQRGSNGFEHRVHRVPRGGRLPSRGLDRPLDEVGLHHAGRIVRDARSSAVRVPTWGCRDGRSGEERGPLLHERPSPLEQVGALVGRLDGVRVHMGQRQCTGDWKVKPIKRKLRQFLGAGVRSRLAPGTVEQWMANGSRSRSHGMFS